MKKKSKKGGSSSSSDWNENSKQWVKGILSLRPPRKRKWRWHDVLRQVKCECLIVNIAVLLWWHIVTIKFLKKIRVILSWAERLGNRPDLNVYCKLTSHYPPCWHLFVSAFAKNFFSKCLTFLFLTLDRRNRDSFAVLQQLVWVDLHVLWKTKKMCHIFIVFH